MSFIARLARNSTLIVADQVVNAVISFLFIAFAARQLGAETFGIYMLAIAVVRFFSMLVNLGISPIALREIAQHPDQASTIAGRFLALRLVLGTLAYIALAIFLATAGYDRETNFLMLILGLTLIGEGVSQSCADLFVGKERFARTTAIQIAAGIANSGAGAAVLFLGGGLRELIFVSVSANLAIALVWIALTLPSMPIGSIRIDRKEAMAIGRQILPLAPLILFNGLNRVLNVFVLSKLPGPVPPAQAVGYYAPAMTMARLPMRFLTSIRRALIPMVSRRLGEGRQVGRELELSVVASILVLCLPLVFATTFYSDELVRLVFGAGYERSAPVLVILGWSVAFRVAVMTVEGFAVSTNRLGRFARVAAIPFAVNLGACLSLIPLLGPAGAAWALFLARLVYLLMAVSYSRTSFGSHTLRLRAISAAAVPLALGLLAGWHLKGMGAGLLVQIPGHLLLAALTMGGGLYAYRRLAG